MDQWNILVSEAVIVGESSLAAKPSALSLQTCICCEKSPSGQRCTPSIRGAEDRSIRFTSVCVCVSFLVTGYSGIVWMVFPKDGTAVLPVPE